jgi:hypothetical protein
MLSRLVRATTTLAIDGEESLRGRSGSIGSDRADDRRDPRLKSLLNGFGLPGNEDAAKAIAGENAVGEREVLPQSILAFGRPPRDGHRPATTAEDARNAGDDDLDEQGLAIARVARVFERFEVSSDRGHIHELVLGMILHRSAVNLAPQIPKRKSPKFAIYARWP